MKRPNYYILPFDRFSYEPDNDIIEYVTEQIDLGVTLTNRRNWETHQDKTKANRQLGMIRRTCHFVKNIAQKRSLYIAIVKSLFEHCGEIWGPTVVTTINKFEPIYKHVGTDDFNTLVTQRFDNSKNTLSVLFLNINGVKSNFDSFLAQAQSITIKFSFICFCETNLKSDEPEYYSIPNYSSEKLYTIDDKHSGSGITVYFKSSLNFKRIEKLCVRNSTFEALGGTFNSNFGKITLLVLYRFHRSDNNINFTKLVEYYISVLKGPVILVGDFNLDILPSEKSSDTNKYINCFLSHGYVPLISKGTRVSRNKITSIDNMWTNITDRHILSNVLNCSISDHFPITCVIPLTIIEYTDNGLLHNITNHNISPDTLNQFNIKYMELVSNTHVSESIVFDPVKAKSDFTSFFNRFTDIYNSTILENKTFSPHRNSSVKPYITLGLSKCCKTKNRLHKTWIRARGTLHEQAAMVAYKTYRFALKTIIFKAKMDYYSNKFELCKDDVKRSWKVVNEIRCKNVTKTLPNSIDVNGKIVTDRRNIMSEFNKYFVSVASKLNETKYSCLQSKPDFKIFLKNRVKNNIEFCNITVSEIDDIIKNFNPNKCSDFSPRLLKLIMHSLSPILKYLLNICMHCGIFPNQLKVAKVLPLYKSGDTNDVSNYRPISILPIFSKLFEKLLCSRLKNFFDVNHVINNDQYGFRAQHSTSHALHSAVSSISQALKSKNKCLGIFIDFQKAFDTVNHQILLEKLDHYGIRGRALCLLNDYLTNRTQYV